MHLPHPASLACLLLVVLLGAVTLARGANEGAASPVALQAKTFVYVLRLIPRLHEDSAWTEKDVAIVQRHAARLTAETNARRVILAGRTTEPGDRTFGLVIFEAADETAARAYMQADPAVAEGVMTATLHPYLIGFQREP